MNTRARCLSLALAVGLASCAAPGPRAKDAVPGSRAKNVILFIGDAGGLPTISAAAAEAGRTGQLFIERMPGIGLMDTSSADEWVGDSASTMTAMVTGEKTRNGVLSESASAERGRQEGRVLKTVLEYAEEHGLSTGVVTNSPLADATPAACYAHVDDRGKTAAIMAQVFSPRAGDGVDVMIGAGRTGILKATAAAGLDLAAEARRHGYEFQSGLEAVSPEARRLIVLVDDENYDVGAAADLARRALSRNGKGYFLMVESDLHANDTARAFRRTVELDRIIERTASAVGESDTLVVFSADHSFDLRVVGGRKGESLLAHAGSPDAAVRVEDSHTGEEVVVAARGPGAHRVRGFFPNTHLFETMMAAYGWTPDTASKE
jgi:alkaline phosphatase